MKLKKLFAVGLLSTSMGVASAQSNVTVYGILDVNMSSTKNSATGSDTVMRDNSMSTSRLGFRGSEDLGGGLKAEFQLETRLAPSTGVAGAGSTTAADSNFFNREAWVGLSSKTYGALRMGTSDVSNAANIDIMVSQAGNLGLASQLGVDKNKVVRYETPKFKGFSAEVGYASPDSTTTTENTKNSIKSGVVKYEAGKLSAYVGTESRKIDSVHTQDHMIVGAKYDFGVIRVGAYHGVKDGATLATANTGESKQTRLSAAIPMKNNYTAMFVYGKDSTATQSTADYDVYRAVLSKDFSKRTSAYAGYSTLNYKAGAADQNTYMAGIVHKF
jgi:predicted porin